MNVDATAAALEYLAFRKTIPDDRASRLLAAPRMRALQQRMQITPFRDDGYDGPYTLRFAFRLIVTAVVLSMRGALK